MKKSFYGIFTFWLTVNILGENPDHSTKHFTAFQVTMVSM